MAGLLHKVEPKIGSAVDTLTKLVENPEELETYDFIFIDADKDNYGN